ncbi:hypothetical protein B5E58_10060 [Tyzzerella sp. An114]|mgnify:CR=1 FL=1|uniref:type II toxin-antitoxin system HicA family toxin n=1 Tax=Tyzzerella sp. An114 TaxID=1965545 RepID=UPI000B4481BA|nr:type II toxin-antitoxin system HicA family toxin [Tyzzerella sp. An114]OUQ56988.1 hypothetical protein B5E58_10060 [Tyzzerella sp. An114]
MSNRPRAYNIREFKEILKKNGYVFVRKGKGDHSIYSNGKTTIAIAKHMNKMIALRLIKENNLKTD